MRAAYHESASGTTGRLAETTTSRCRPEQAVMPPSETTRPPRATPYDPVPWGIVHPAAGRPGAPPVGLVYCPGREAPPVRGSSRARARCRSIALWRRRPLSSSPAVGGNSQLPEPGRVREGWRERGRGEAHPPNPEGGGDAQDRRPSLTAAPPAAPPSQSAPQQATRWQ